MAGIIVARNSSKTESGRGARERQRRLRDRLSSWRRHHQFSARDSWMKLLGSPFQSMMTILVIAIALALPSALQLVVSNLQQLSVGIESSAQISLYLQQDLSDDRVQLLQKKLLQHDNIAGVTYLSADDALQEFQDMAGLSTALQLLEDNPLPAVIMVQPAAILMIPELIADLVAELRSWSDIDDVRLDMEWVQRLHAILEIGRRIAAALALALALGVLLVVGNTIRLAVQNRRDEIVVVKLVGGTDGYVRRPFLYTGIWYGLLGGFLAWLLVGAGLQWLSSVVTILSGMYQSSFSLAGLGLAEFLKMLMTGMILGLVGAWLAVGKHLRDIEPE